MTVVTRPANAADAEALARFWHVNMNSKLGLDRWRTIAACPWYGEPPNRGWLAVDNGRIVGAMALVHSLREVGGCRERFCNIGSLYVLGEYRGQGLARAIARESTADESITYFGIDAAPQTRAVLEPPAVGFGILDDRRYIWRRNEPDPSLSVTVHSSGVMDDAGWTDEERRIVRHHLPLGLLPVTARRGGTVCRLLLWVRNKSSAALYHEVFYASDYELFGRMASGMAGRLLAESDALLAADARLFAESPPGSSVEPLRQPRHFKSRRVAAARYRPVVLGGATARLEAQLTGGRVRVVALSETKRRLHHARHPVFEYSDSWVQEE
jgi:GNAT superfamily N-acetyltransferase